MRHMWRKWPTLLLALLVLALIVVTAVVALGPLLAQRGVDAVRTPSGNDTVSAPKDNQESVDQRVLANAQASSTGKQLGARNYQASVTLRRETSVVNLHLVDWLNDQQKQAGLQPSGAYVIFAPRDAPAQLPSTVTTSRPHIIVDAGRDKDGAVALTQNYSDGRGVTCFSAPGIDSVWNALQDILRGQSLNNHYTVNHHTDHRIPNGRSYSCYTQES